VSASGGVILRPASEVVFIFIFTFNAGPISISISIRIQICAWAAGAAHTLYAHYGTFSQPRSHGFVFIVEIK